MAYRRRGMGDDTSTVALSYPFATDPGLSVWGDNTPGGPIDSQLPPASSITAAKPQSGSGVLSILQSNSTILYVAVGTLLFLAMSKGRR